MCVCVYCGIYAEVKGQLSVIGSLLAPPFRDQIQVIRLVWQVLVPVELSLSLVINMTAECSQKLPT